MEINVYVCFCNELKIICLQNIRKFINNLITVFIVYFCYLRIPRTISVKIHKNSVILTSATLLEAHQRPVYVVLGP